MITINKNMKWDSMIPGDWDFMPGLVSIAGAVPSNTAYRKAGFIDLSGWDATYLTNFWANNGYGIKGQGAWVLASFTQEEIDYIMNNSNSSYQTSVGTFPIIDKLLVPQISTDVSGVTKFTFADRCVLTPYNVTGINSVYPSYIHAVSYDWSSTNYANGARSFSGTGKGSKYQIPSTYTGHTSKGNFTHLVYVFGRGFSADIVSANNAAQHTAVMNSGQLYIDTRQFAAFTVGLEGSGADIIMSDTSIIPGKTIFFGNTDDTKIVVSMNTTLTVQ